MTYRRIFAALAVLCALVIPAHAQKTKAQINTEIGTSFVDNSVGAITPQILRNVTSDIVNSIMPTAPVVSGNLACFSGTTGLLQDCGNTINGNTVFINPTPNSLTQGINISQTGPLGGSFPSTTFNTINVVDQGMTITGAGADPDAFGLSNLNTTGLRVNYTTTNSQLRGALAAAIRVVGTTSSSYGSSGSAYTDVNAVGGMWGAIGSAGIGQHGSANSIVALEGEAYIATGGSALYRAGVGANSQGPAGASVLDTAFLISTGPNAGSLPFDKIFSFSSQIYGPQSPVRATTDIFFSDASITIANVFNSLNWNVTGNFANFPNFGISGAGQATFGVPLSALAPGHTVDVSGAGKGRVGIGVNSNTTTGSSFIEMLNSTNASQIVLLANEAARTTARYGRTLGNYTELSAFSGNGLIIGTQTSTPIIFGTNNAYAGRVAGGQWGFGADVAPIAGPILSLNQNTAAPTIAVDATPALQIVGAANGLVGLESDSFGTGQNVWTMRSALGTAAAPTQYNAAGVVGTQQYRALDETGAYRTIAAIDAVSTGAVTSTDWSGYFRIRTGTTGSTLAERVHVQLGVNIGGTTDPGVGNLNLTGGSLLNNGTAPTGTGAYVRAISPALTTPSLGVATATSINGATLDNTAWTAYTPTATPASGTLTGATVTPTGRYKQIGKTILCEYNIAITAVGSGTPGGAVQVSVPVSPAAAFPFVGTSMETSIGKLGWSFISSSSTIIRASDYTGGTFWVNGNNVVGTVIYEVP